jgi:hypothetical protein
MVTKETSLSNFINIYIKNFNWKKVPWHSQNIHCVTFLMVTKWTVTPRIYLPKLFSN